ncbi:C2H2-type domain-containing protein [Entamoeba marina]
MKEPNDQETIRYSCDFDGCTYTSNSIEDIQLHYTSTHYFVCSLCGKNLQCGLYLDIHISEIHDSFFKVNSLHTPSYRCFVGGCPCKFSTTEERRKHLMEHHHWNMFFITTTERNMFL